MNEALRTATALCGFNSMVMEIEEKKIYQKQSNIKDVSKIHCVKYVVDEQEPKYHVWQYYGIGKGKLCNVGIEPLIVKRKITIPFKNDHLSFGRAKVTQEAKKDIVYCSEPMSIKSFSSVDLLLKHLDYGRHEYQATKSSQMLCLRDQWVKRFTDGDAKSLPGGSQILSADNFEDTETLQMGWAIPKRAFRR